MGKRVHYGLTARKREWVPEGLWAWLCRWGFRRILTREPLRTLLTTPIGSDNWRPR